MGTNLEILISPEDIDVDEVLLFMKDFLKRNQEYHELFFNSSDGSFGLGVRGIDFEEASAIVEELLTDHDEASAHLDFFDGDYRVEEWFGAKAVQRNLDRALQELEIAQARVNHFKAQLEEKGDD